MKLLARVRDLQENWLVVKACINQIKQGAAMSKHAKQKLDAFYQQVGSRLAQLLAACLATCCEVQLSYG